MLSPRVLQLLDNAGPSFTVFYDKFKYSEILIECPGTFVFSLIEVIKPSLSAMFWRFK